jgi:iron complex transport system ATP-binding protein
MSAAPALAFEGLAFRYGPGGTEALRELTADIARGEATAILGPNGAGKTTLLHLALGWLAPLRGRVLLDGRPLASLSRRELGRAMALVPQSERIPFDVSVLDYVLLGRAPYLGPLESPGAADEAAALAAIARVGIGRLSDRAVTALSGGERQLASIARALAQGPRVLLLDEPTAHLDLANKARLLGLVRELAAEGTTVLFTTHEPEAAAMAATRLLLVREGRLLESGPLDELFESGRLSAAYGLPVEAREIEGRRVALWWPADAAPRKGANPPAGSKGRPRGGPGGGPSLELWRELVEARARGRAAAGRGAGNDYWRGRAREYDERVRRRRNRPDPIREAVLSRVEPGSTVLDIGAGTGAWLPELSRRAGRVVAIEPSEDMRSVLLERVEEEGLTNVEVVAESWPLASPPPCDLALCSHALYGSPDFAAFAGAMDEAASRFCLIVLRAPRPDFLLAEAAREAFGRPHDGPNIFVAYGALVEMGMAPEILMEEGERFDDRRFPSPESALAEVESLLGIVGADYRRGTLEELVRSRLLRDGEEWILRRDARSGLLSWRPRAPGS